MISDPFDLTPASVRYQQTARSIAKRYLFVAVTLGGLLLSVLLSRLQSQKEQTRSLHELASRAMPVDEYRRTATLLDESNAIVEQAIEAVESARPNDSLLQGLAAAAQASVTKGLQPRQLHLRLAVEQPDGLNASALAQSHLRMMTETNDAAIVSTISDLFDDELRFTDLKIESVAPVGETVRTEMVATPRTEAILP
jgi:hypothetical protein